VEILLTGKRHLTQSRCI